MDWAELLGWVGSALFLVRLVPQPLRIWRTGRTHGVSAQAAVNASVSDTGWLFYGLAAGLAPVWACTLLAVPLDLWTAWLLRDKVTFRGVVASAAWGLVMVIAWFVGGQVALGGVLGASVLINNAPHVWAALRGDQLAGIAPVAWYFALADAVLWGGYGVIVGAAGLITYGAVLLSASTIVLFRLWQVGGSEGLRPEFPDGVPDPVENL